MKNRAEGHAAKVLASSFLSRTRLWLKKDQEKDKIGSKPDKNGKHWRSKTNLFCLLQLYKQALNLENPSPADNKIASLMDTIAYHAAAIPKITSSFATPTPPPPPFINPLQQEATPTPTPTTSEALTSFTSLSNFAEEINKAIKAHNFNYREETQAEKRGYIKLVDSTSLYKAAATLFEFELTKILIDKMEKNKSFDVGNYKRELYDALIKSHNTDKDIFESYGDVFSLKRSRNERDKDRDPFAGSNRGTKRRKSSKDDVSSRDSKSKEKKSSSTFKDTSQSRHKSFYKSAHAEEPSHTVEESGKQQDQEFTWISQVAHAEEPPSSFDELNDTLFDLSAFVINRLNIPYLTQEILVGPAFNLLKGTYMSITKLEYHLEKCSKTTTERFDWHNPKNKPYPFDLRKPLSFIQDYRGRQNRRKRLMRSDELYKFSDGTLNDVRSTLYDIAAGIRLEYLPMRKWSNLDKKRARNQRDLPRDISQDIVVVLRYEKRSKTKNMGKVPTEMELVLEQTQQEHETEATKDMVHPTNNGSTKDVKPLVIPTESSILNSEPVISPIIEPVASPVSAPRPNQRPSIPYPSRFFADALILIPKFGPSIKSLLTNKDKLCELARTPLNEHCSVVLLKKLPKKLGDPDKFLILCDFLEMAECLAMADLGVCINQIPLSMWNKLSLPDLSPTCMTLELVDRLISRQVGVAEDVFVKVEAITFNLDQTSRYSANYNDMTTNRIDVIEMAYEEYSQEVLSFSDVIMSSNPTPYYDLIVSTTSLTLTPFGNSDFLLEEVDAFLALEDDPTSSKVDQTYLPQVRKELKICEAKTDKSSIDEPPKVELKDLPPHIEYVFLEGDDKLPVIIVKDMSVEEKTALILVLKSHKRAIAWKLFDIKGIDPEFCTHKILMEEDFEPTIQNQRRVNPRIHDVFKNEVLKLLDTGLIYSISDTPWVSPVHCVPKKGGFTVVKNEVNELIPTRLVTVWRVYIDYRKLNEATCKYHFPLPFMDQMLEGLAGNQYYCFLDGFSGYFQISINLKDQEITTFTCPYRTFAYRRMPFRLCNAPGTFQRCMMAIFHDMIEKTMEVFMDDFSVFRNFFQTCLSHLEKMLKRCEDTNLCLNWEKSHFMVKEVLGQRQEKHFRPIHYASKTMIEEESNYTTTEKEMLAVVYAFEKFRSYLIMNKSIMYMDHCTLKYLFAKKDSKARLLRWVLLLQEFTFKVIDTKGAENLAADHHS
nr:reverse transcriptase domain-containing protein [Tanacetum cinerariifolium]